MRTIGERMKWLIGHWLPERKRFTTLERVSGIPADHWKNFWHGRQRAHEHMIQALARQWPEYAFWLVAGIDDSDHGHTVPPDGPISNESRSATGRLLTRRIEIDEALNSTATLAVLKDAEMYDQADIEKQTQLLERYGDNLFELLELCKKYDIPFDMAGVTKTLASLMSNGANGDPKIVELTAERRAELAHGNQED